MTNPEPRPQWSDAQIMAAISAALKAGDMESVVGLIRVLALQNPHEAGVLVDAIQLLGGRS